MTNNEALKTPREETTRERQTREDITFVPPGLLPEVVNKEPGYEYRWIRVSAMGQPDTPNVNSRFREGWEPVDPKDHPEIKQFEYNEKYKGMIEHGGLVLCKNSIERVKARQKYYEQQAANQITAVDNNFMRESDRRMPLFKEGRTTVERGRKPEDE